MILRPDVVIVGGGIVGTAAAADLADHGARVVLLEAVEVAAGASGRNSGSVQQPFDPALGPIYRSTLEAYRALAADPDLAFDLPPEAAGLLLVGRDPSGVRRMAIELRAQLGASVGSGLPAPEVSFLDWPDVERLEPSLAPGTVACRVAIGYPIPPAAATRALAALATRRGAEIRSGARATALMSDAAGKRGVRLSDGTTIQAGAVLISAGSSSPALIDPAGRWRPILPLWGVVAEVGLASPPSHVLEEAEMDEALGPIAVRGDEATRPDAGVRGDDGDPAGVLSPRAQFSLVTAAGSSSLGSTFLDGEPDIDSWVPRLVERGRQFVPSIASAPVVASRSCARPRSVDGRPLLGAVPGMPDVFICAGHGPWGISTGPGSARLVVDVILGRDQVIPASLDVARFGVPAAATYPAPR